MRYLILVRHAQPHIMPERPAQVWNLSEKGRTQCGALADALTRYSPSFVVSSVEPKAAQTAVLVAERLGVPSAEAEGLHEHERKTVGYLGANAFQSAVHRFFTEPDALVLGEETARQAQHRFTQAVAEVCTHYPVETLVVVAHGTVITLYAQQVSGIEPYPFWLGLGMPAFVAFDQSESRIVEVGEVAQSAE